MKYTQNQQYILTEVSDFMLAIKAKAGSKKSYSTLYGRYFKKIYRYVYWRAGGDRQLAEDLTQQALITGWEKIGSFNSFRGSFRAWIFTIVHNSMVDYFRRHHQQSRIEKYLEVSGNDDGERLLNTLSVEQALSELNTEQKNVIILRFLEGLSVKATARIVGKTNQAVRAIQYRALQKLKKILEV
ncbi:hypothetical protein A2154_01615 [Candidatus Gottesmanbacteria bacterium RBG_16_43_7]|uniref:RNA polymerase sigma factor n=1 Tax=Candidatus Gottesmanbacteria bacterium RBG_16_43_7 TaxID=1798373 RepID=A0A1F5ZB90_9BACT|nr:MAG: hypothetical protein A2154_01615 [Candidatus Gottesmanbacteria bacterium RBG_16_43_7]